MNNLIESTLSTVEDTLVMLSTRIAPWLAPIGPAYFIGRAAYNELHAHIAIAICMAVAVEMVGMATTHTALKAWTWNKTKRKIDPTAPLWLCIILALFYYVGAIVLTVVVEVYPQTVAFAPAIFITLGAVSSMAIAMQFTLRKWELARHGKRQKTRQSATQTTQTTVASRSKRLELLPELVNSGNSNEDIAEILGVNVRTVQRDIKALNGSLSNEMR